MEKVVWKQLGQKRLKDLRDFEISSDGKLRNKITKKEYPRVLANKTAGTEYWMITYNDHQGIPCKAQINVIETIKDNFP